MQLNPKKVVIIISVSFVFVLLIWWLISFLTTGYLIIVASDPESSISITKSQEGQAPKTIQARSGQTVGLSPGTYIVNVARSLAATSQVVQVKAAQTQKYTINLTSAAVAETVASANAQSISADASQLMYLDQSDNRLYKIDTNNNLSLVSNGRFQSIFWADGFFGISESVGKLYAFNNGQFSDLQQPEAGKKFGSYDIAPNRQIYIAVDDNVYTNTPTGSFKKIFTANGKNLRLIASINSVAVMSSPGRGDNKAHPTITVVKLDGTNTTKDLEAYTGAWSPDGKHLVITDDTGSEVLDSNLKEVAVAPHTNFNNPVWLDNDKIIYSVYDQLWQYSLSKQISTQIARAANQHVINRIAVSNDKSYVYINIDSKGIAGDYEIARVGLKGQPVSEIAKKVSSSLPLVSSRCVSILINFTQPTILERPLADGDSNKCTVIDRITLKNAGHDVDKLKFLPSSLSADSN